MILGSSNYVKTADLQGGEFVTFKNEGTWVESTKYTYPDGNPKQDFVIKVKIGEQEKDLRLNKTNRDILIAAFGNDTSNWVGMSVKLNKVQALVAGKMLDVLIVEAGNQESKDAIDQEPKEDTQNEIPF